MLFKYGTDKMSRSISLLYRASCCSHAHDRLETVINPPLKARQGTYHGNAGKQSFQHEVSQTHFVRNRQSRFPSVRLFAHQTHQRVRGVTHNGTNDSGQVSRSKCNAQLCGFRVGLFGLCKDVRVPCLDDFFKKVEFGHGVCDDVAFANK